jgi:hypothetical protein
MEKKKGKIILLSVTLVVLVTAVFIASIHLINQSEEARIEEQKEAILQTIPDINKWDLEYLLSRNIYAAYGTVRHNQDLDEILQSAKEEFEEKHLYHWNGEGGPIFGHGVDYLSCIEIYLYDEYPVNRTITDEIYQVIEEQARATGTNDTPVIFIRAGLIKLDTRI